MTKLVTNYWEPQSAHDSHVHPQKPTSMHGLAKVWWSYNMAAMTPVDSLNVSSFAAIATGQARINFTNGFNPQATVIVGTQLSNTVWTCTQGLWEPSNYTEMYTWNSSGALANSLSNGSGFGDLVA